MGNTPVALVGWELGSGRGHVEPLVPLIDALLMQGWRVVAAMRDVATARSALSKLAPASIGRLDLRQAPIFLHRAVPPSRPLFSLAEILVHAGFADAKLWRPVMTAWGRIIDEVGPQIVIADCAPSLALAARGRVRTVVTGNGWTLPPDLEFVPPLPLRDYNREVAVAAERAIHSTAARLKGNSDGLPRFVDLLRGDENFVFTHPLLDPYRSTRRERTWWPANIHVLPRSNVSLPEVVAYLPNRHPAQANLVDAIDKAEMRAIAYFGNSDLACSDRIAISKNPLDLAHVLARAPCAVHHGGLGMTGWCLAHGVPQLLMPTDLEKHMNAAAVVSAGRGVVVSPNTQAASIAVAIQHAIGLEIDVPAASNPRETVEAVVDACTSCR